MIKSNSTTQITLNWNKVNMLSLRPEKGTRHSEALVTDFDDLPSVGYNMSLQVILYFQNLHF